MRAAPFKGFGAGQDNSTWVQAIFSSPKAFEQSGGTMLTQRFGQSPPCCDGSSFYSDRGGPSGRTHRDQIFITYSVNRTGHLVVKGVLQQLLTLITKGILTMNIEMDRHRGCCEEVHRLLETRKHVDKLHVQKTALCHILPV